MKFLQFVRCWGPKTENKNIHAFVNSDLLYIATKKIQMHIYVLLLLFGFTYSIQIIFYSAIPSNIFHVPFNSGIDLKHISSLVIGCFIFSSYAQRAICLPCPLPPYF